MKLFALLTFIVLIALLAAPYNIASAQVTSQNPPAKSDQWQSHQMNQAKQELQKKLDKKASDKK